MALEPNAARAAALDRRMREKLEISLRHILFECADYLALDRSLLNGFFGRLHTGPVSPLVFGAYFELVFAVESDNLADARRLLHEIAQSTEQPGAPLITELSPSTASNRYRRLIDIDPSARFEIQPAPSDIALRARRLIEEAFALMDRGAATLACEIRALLRETVLASSPASDDAITFEGASSFMLWGAIVLNARLQDSALGMVQALAHESGHNLLFGLCADVPLVEDDGIARYPSPLRKDERPMDGIVHATFVSARMHYAVSRLMNASVLSVEQAASGLDALAEHRSNFYAGLDVVERYGKLSPLGHSVLSDARRYIIGGVSTV